MKDVYIFNPYKNQAVTNEYVDTIKNSLEKDGFSVRCISKMNRSSKNCQGIVVITIPDAIKAKIYGYRNCILWVQGAWPEESFMRHNSLIRLKVLNIMERIAISKANSLLFVSLEMKNYLEKKHHVKIKNYFIMPCFNERIHDDVFGEKEKYGRNSFCYIGGLSKWQCFDKIATIYKYIENNTSESEFFVFN